MFGIVAFLYGFDGYNTIFQFVLLRPFDLTIGQAALILVALSFAGAALVSLFTMMFSELTKNSVATIGTITGVMLVTMFIMGNARQSEITFRDMVSAAEQFGFAQWCISLFCTFCWWQHFGGISVCSICIRCFGCRFCLDWKVDIQSLSD